MARILVKDALPGKRYKYTSDISPDGVILEMCSTAITEISPRPKLLLDRKGCAWAYKVENDVLVGKRCLIPIGVGVDECDARPWRGWAAKHVDLMTTLMTTFTACGCWIESKGKDDHPLPHYYRIGHKSKTIMVLYRGGLIGFRSKPDGKLGDYPVYPTADGESYMLFKIFSPEVFTMGRWDELVADIKTYLKARVGAAA